MLMFGYCCIHVYFNVMSYCLCLHLPCVTNATLLIAFRLCVASVPVRGKVEILYVPLHPQEESGSTALERIVCCTVSVL